MSTTERCGVAVWFECGAIARSCPAWRQSTPCKVRSSSADAAELGAETGVFLCQEESVVAEIVYENVLDEGTPLPIGGVVGSGPIDVNGARAVHLMFGVREPHADIYWRLNFGPLTNGAFALTNSGTFEDGSSVAIAVPVFAPSLFLELENQSTQDETGFGTIYFIRDVT